MSINYKGIFVDDNEIDKEIYKDIINSLNYKDEKIKVSGLSPLEIMETASKIIADKVSIVFLDFRLDDDLASNGLSINQGYKGGGLAQVLREKVNISKGDKDFPIVLISSEQNIQRLYDPEKTTHDLFDSCYSKEYISEMNNHEKLSKKLIALIKGYIILNNIDTDINLFECFSLIENEDNREVLYQQDVELPLKNSSLPHVRARFILKNIIRREGLLLSIHEIAAKMGTSVSELKDKHLEKISSCKYEGIFSYGWERWWSHLFEEFIVETVGHRPYNLTSKERIAIINEKFNFTLEPAKSRWNNKEDEKSVFACTLCRSPTEIKHSLSVYDSTTYKFIQKKRLCFFCIRNESYESKNIFIDEHDRKFLKTINT